MKRFWFAIPLIAALSACSSPIPQMRAPSLDIFFSAEAGLKYGGEECTVQMRRINADKWEFCVTDPYPLEGLIITVNDGKTALTMYDKESIADINSDAVSAAKIISEAFEAAAGSGSTSFSEVKDSTDGTAYSMSGQCSFGTYTIALNEDMQPVSFAVDDRGISADITKFALIEKGDEAVIAE